MVLSAMAKVGASLHPPVLSTGLPVSQNIPALCKLQWDRLKKKMNMGKQLQTTHHKPNQILSQASCDTGVGVAGLLQELKSDE